MTNLEKYNKILMNNLRCKESELNDEILRYNRYPTWDSIAHLEMIPEFEDKFCVQFDTLDVTSFSNYSEGIRILKEKGIQF